jgi:hypothetical protein
VGARVAINGMQVYYEVSGAGDPLIVLHGAYMNIPMMGAIIPKLAETHKVYALRIERRRYSPTVGQNPRHRCGAASGRLRGPNQPTVTTRRSAGATG